MQNNGSDPEGTFSRRGGGRGVPGQANPLHADVAPSGAAVVTAVRRRWRAVLLGAVVGLAAAGGYLVVRAPEYQATASVLVTPTQTDPGSLVTGGIPKDAVNLDTESQLVTSSATVQEARSLLHTGSPSQDLVSSVSTSVPVNTSVLQISFTATSPTQARDGADAFAHAYLDARAHQAQMTIDQQLSSLKAQIDNVHGQLDTATAKLRAAKPNSVDQAVAQADVDVLTSQLSTLTQTLGDLSSSPVTPGRIIDDAAVPSSPAGPGPAIVLGAGLLLGLLLSVALAVALERLNRRIRDVADVERLVGVPVTALPRGKARALPELEPATSEVGREFRRLQNEVSATLPPGRRVVVVTSAGVGANSAAVASNLAAALCQSGNAVVLVGADPGFPPLHAAYADVAEPAGLAEVLSGGRAPGEVTRAVPEVPRLRVMSPGVDTADLSLQLQGEAMARLVDTLTATADFVILHAAPASASPDAQSLARLGNAAVIVVESDRTAHADLTDTVTQLEQVLLQELWCLVVPPQPRHAAARPGAEAVAAASGVGGAGTSSQDSDSSTAAVAIRR